jgi:hypothetical protein
VANPSAIPAGSDGPSDRMVNLRGQLAVAADPHLSAAQLHGLACVVCGTSGGCMVPDPNAEIDRLLDPEELFGGPMLVRCAGLHASDCYRESHSPRSGVAAFSPR